MNKKIKVLNLLRQDLIKKIGKLEAQVTGIDKKIVNIQNELSKQHNSERNMEKFLETREQAKRERDSSENTLLSQLGR